MSKIRVLSDHLANQIAAGEVVERPASVAKELVENSIDAGARRITVDVEGGGRRLLRVADDGEGMTRDDALLAFERHATSKISSADDLNKIATLGFRGEALASIASVARVELVTKTADAPAATRVIIEGGRIRDVKDAAHPQGTTLTIRDLFFNVPARRKFLRSEATESFHLANLVTHYALAHPEIAFTLTNNGRETLRATPAKDLRERAYQIFGAEFLENLLEVGGGQEQIARVRGFISAPRERRTSRDAQYLFINGRYVRDRLISRALSEGYRAILPQGVYPAALLFLDVPLEEVDVNVHPAKTEVRFRRAAAIGDAVREAVRKSLASAGYASPSRDAAEETGPEINAAQERSRADDLASGAASSGLDQFPQPEETLPSAPSITDTASHSQNNSLPDMRLRRAPASSQQQSTIEFGPAAPQELSLRDETDFQASAPARSDETLDASAPVAHPTGGTDAIASAQENARPGATAGPEITERTAPVQGETFQSSRQTGLPPVVSVDNFVREVTVESLSVNIRPLGQLAQSYILATDDDGLLLIDQHAAHERVLFDKYHALEGQRQAESQNLLLPETFDLTPAQAAAFDQVSAELETYGFGLMRLSGRTVAVKAVPADLPAGEARSMLMEVLETVDAEKRGSARATLREGIAASLARRAAIKANTPLATEKMRWLIDRLLNTSSPTTCPHGHPTILRLATRDIEKGFHHS
jgi:DNA mismatch repair protein MutL